MLSFTDCRRMHLPAVRDFWSRAYGPQHVLGRDPALFEWQFADGAGGRAASGSHDGYHMKLAMDGERVVGCLGYIPTEVVVRGRSLRGTWLANWMVDPSQARLGIGPLLLREVVREVDTIVNVGISDDARALLVRLGWLDLGTLARWVCALDPARAELLLPDDARGDWPAEGAQLSNEGLDVRQVDAFGETAGALWDTLWGAECAGTRRSAALLNWRYANHPCFRYELIELHEHERLVGVAVYRIEQVREPAVRVGRIVELVVTPAASAALIGAVRRHATERGVAVLDFFCSSMRLDEDLQRQGFQRGDTGRAASMPHLFQPIDRRRSGIACMINGSGVDLPQDRDAWYVTKGDADQDRPN